MLLFPQCVDINEDYETIIDQICNHQVISTQVCANPVGLCGLYRETQWGVEDKLLPNFVFCLEFESYFS